MILSRKQILTKIFSLTFNLILIAFFLINTLYEGVIPIESNSNIYLYTRKLKYEHFTPAFRLHNNLCEVTALEHKFKVICVLVICN